MNTNKNSNLPINLLNELLIKSVGNNKNITVINKIAEGGYGKVYIGKYDGYTIVLKIIQLEITNDINYKNKKKLIQEEINIHRNLNHPNIIRSFNHTTFLYDNYEYFVIFMYNAINKDLYTFIHYMEKNILKISNNTVNFKFIFYYSEISILFLISQIIKGLFCMHEHNIIHSDLKPQNILIFNNFNIKITDFSISTSINKSKNTFLHIGTLNYSCFECINGITLSINATKVDFFSLGITILEIIMKNTLNYKKDDLSFKKDIDQFSKSINDALNELKNLNLLLGNYYSKELIILIQGLLNPDPNERFGFKEIVNSKWINNNYKVMNHIYKINVYENELKLFIELQKNSKLLNIKNSYRRKYCINF